MIEKRLISLEKRLEKDNILKNEYEDIFIKLSRESYQEKDYLKEVQWDDKRETKWLLPNFPIVKRDKESSKVRLVFDAAAKQNGICLNDVLHTGPKLQMDIFETLLKFRRFKIAFACDIQEMYLQIQINKDDRTYLRFSGGMKVL